jgi:hypothetical protein
MCWHALFFGEHIIAQSIPTASATRSSLSSSPLSDTLLAAPCAQVAALQTVKNRRVSTELAYCCYQSVPVNFEGDLQLINDLELRLE